MLIVRHEMGFIRDRMELHAVAVGEIARGLQSAGHAVEDALRRIGPSRPWGVPADALERLTLVIRARSPARPRSWTTRASAWGTTPRCWAP